MDIKGKICKRCRKTPAKAISRTFSVCTKCYDLMKRDNQARINKCEDIPKNDKIKYARLGFPFD